jgi:LysR family hydrogen peroxide-inducible transcriptional activator
MTLQELRFVVSLARLKHFGLAAEACFVSQPTLSIAIRKLEQKLKIPLFERNKNEIKITPLGEKIVERAQQVLEQVNCIKQLAASEKDQLVGPFKLSAIYTIGPYLFPPLIMGLTALAPLMPLQIHEDFTANLKEKLKQGETDAIIVSTPFEDPSLVTKLLYTESFLVLMRTNHPLAQYEKLPEAALAEHNLLLLGAEHCFKDQVMRACPSCFVDGQRVNQRHTVVGSSLETIRHMVASGMGITLLPMSAVYESSISRYKNLTLRPLLSASPSREVILAWRKTYPRLKAIDAILNAVAACELDGIHLSAGPKA